MDLHPFSLNNNKNPFPKFELVIVVFLILFMYSIGIHTLPNIMSNIDQFVYNQNEQRLINTIQHSSLIFEVNEGEEHTYTLRILLNDGIIDRSENKSFFAKYSLDSSVTVGNEKGEYIYSVHLIEVD